LLENVEFWDYLDRLVEECPVVIDRPRGSIHPRYPKLIYPLAYGYLEGSTSVDGGGIDVFVGQEGGTRICGMMCTVDLHKLDAEIKLLLGCTEADIRMIFEWLNGATMRAQYVPRAL
jgi:inorganic pyrophosphatase